jgi:transcriptional regulator GlxA family with amidase domain
MNFGFLLFPDVAELDFVGPWELLGDWRRASKEAPEPLTIAARAGAVRCVNGLTVHAETSFADAPPLDYLLVPGGYGVRHADPSVVEFVQQRAGACRALLSVCTGALLLQRAGLLAGRRATTHWSALSTLRAAGDVTVIEERFVQDGDLWTAAGVSAGIDMMLAFIAHTAGEEIAATVQAYAEVFPTGKRYGRFDERPEAPAYLKRTR